MGLASMLHTTPQIALDASVAPSTIWWRARKLGLTPVQYVGSTALWSDDHRHALTVGYVPGKAGRPRVRQLSTPQHL